MDSESQLYKQCIAGDKNAQAALFKLYAPKMLGICFRYSHNLMAAEDVLQDAFIRVFKFMHQYNGEGSLEGWIRKTVVNTALNQIKKNRHIAEELELEHAKGVETNAEVQVDNYDSKLIMSALQQLPDGYRAILNLFAIEGYSHREIAEQMGIAESTSRSQFLRAKQLLKKILEEHEILV